MFSSQLFRTARPWRTLRAPNLLGPWNSSMPSTRAVAAVMGTRHKSSGKLHVEDLTVKSEDTKGGRKRWNGVRITVTGLLILMPIFCFQLGNWQYRRLKWKTDLIEKLKDRINAPAVSINKFRIPETREELSEFEKVMEFTRFRLKGVFVHEEELFVGPKFKDDVRGYYVYTPLRITEEGVNKGKKVIVERGFISEKFVSPESRIKSHLAHLAVPKGEVCVEGILRSKITPGNSAVENPKNIRLLVYNDIQDMAERSGSTALHIQQVYDPTDAFIVRPPKAAGQGFLSSVTKLWRSQADAGGSGSGSGSTGVSEKVREYSKNVLLRNGVPIGSNIDPNLRNNHLEYMVTWYSLAIVSSGLLYYAFRGKSSPLESKLAHARKYQ